MMKRWTGRFARTAVAACIAGVAGAACGVATDGEADEVGAEDEAVGETTDELANGLPVSPTEWRVARIDDVCSGTVIDEHWVLSARHCLDGNKDPSWIDVGLGDEGRNVTHVYLHPDHLDGENGVDVMMLRLEEPFTNILASEVPIYSSDTDNLIGQDVFCAGYGGTFNTIGLTGGVFEVIDDGDYDDPDRFYRLEQPNGLGQELIGGDSGSSCRLGPSRAVTGVHKGDGQTSAEAFKAWAEKRRDCPGFDPNDLSTGFCSADCPCDVGEGDCDSNAQCLPGLYCRPADVGNGLDANYSVCDRINTFTCGPPFNAAAPQDEFCRYSALENCTCAHGEGDCDEDHDCGGSLVCQVNTGFAVGLPSSYGVCIYPTPPQCPAYSHGVDDDEFCTTECPCDLGQGDCDSDAECRGGLVCRSNVGAQFTKPSNYDMCVRP